MNQTYKYTYTVYITAPEGIDLRDRLGQEFENKIDELWLDRVEKDLNFSCDLVTTRIVAED